MEYRHKPTKNRGMTQETKRIRRKMGKISLRGQPTHQKDTNSPATHKILRSSGADLDYHPSHNLLPPGSVQRALDILFPKEAEHANDPKGWVNGRLGEYIWSKQVEIANSVRDNRYTAVPACHGPGKSFIAARIMGWWLDTHPLGSAFAISTAPTAPQIGAILWRELRRLHRKASLRGRLTLDNQWYMTDAGTRNSPSPDDELIAMGRKPADYDQAAFQGIHARYVLAVLDEACGIPKNLYDAVDSIVTGDDCRVLAIGNPDDPGSHFANICAPGSGWNVIPISAFDTPNFTGEQVPDEIRHVLVTPNWVKEREKRWGIGSPLWVSKVEGKFPDVSDETLFPPSMIRRACETELPGIEQGQYGADIARYGTDRSVVYRNRGFQIRKEAEWHKQDTMQSAGRIKTILHKHRQPPKVVVDVIGLGSGVYDRLREQGLPVVPHAGSESARRPSRFKNRRAEVYWTFRELMDDGLVDLDPEDEDLLSQMASIKWDTDSSGRIFIETKEDMRKRGLPSPDHLDAAILSTVMNTSLRDLLSEENLQHRIRHSEEKSIAGDVMSRAM
jgi:hypothetical protein